MDCKFRVFVKNRKTFEKLKEFASGWSKNLLIIEAKCSFFEYLKIFDVEMLIIPFRASEGEIDCFYYDGEMKDCNKEILEKFDMSKFEPIEWKNINDMDIPF